jgi:hypothetical protein
LRDKMVKWRWEATSKMILRWRWLRTKGNIRKTKEFWLLLLVFETGSCLVQNPSWPWTHNSPTSASKVLELQTCATMPSKADDFLNSIVIKMALGFRLESSSQMTSQLWNFSH